MGLRRVRAGDGMLEVEDVGSGEPVVVIQTALAADELRPLAEGIARHGYRVLHYHRRGYAGSDAVARPPSIAADADDCLALLTALDVVPAHVVGASYSAAVALTLAARAPGCLRTLAAVEPPPVHGAGRRQFRAANARLQRIARTTGPLGALEEFMTMLGGADWRAGAERDQPGSVPAMERDAGTFFATDVPALLSWELTAADTARIRRPVLLVGGAETGRWFADARARLLRLLPGAEEAVVPGAGHLLASTHPGEASAAVAAFLGRAEAVDQRRRAT